MMLDGMITPQWTPADPATCPHKNLARDNVSTSCEDCETVLWTEKEGPR